MSSRHWLVAALAIPLASSAEGPDPLGAWISDRAREHEAYLRGEARGRGATGALFYERTASELPADFAPPKSLAPLIRAVRPGVVNVSAVNEGGATRSLGSGFLITPDGFLVTNDHVVAQARQIQVALADGRQLAAEIVGEDPSTDVALLRLQGAEGRELPFTYLGDSDALEVGDWVVAIGNPFGLDHSVSHGMISAKERVLGIGVFDDFIQTDAQINPGNSGGPLFNMRGEVVGVNTAVVTQGQGIGFAVPINMVKDLLPNLRVNGRHLARGWLGVNIREAGEGEREEVVTDVFAGGPAALAGLAPGDRVLSVNGRPVESYLELLRRIAILAPGTEVRLRIRRGDRQREVTVRLAERPAEPVEPLAGPGAAEALGLVVREVTQEIASALGLSPGAGVLVARVVPGSGADRAGIRAGDLVTEVNRRKVHDVRAFRSALEQTGRDKPALVRVQRAGEAREVAISPGAR